MDAVSKFAWDSEIELVTLSRASAAALLERYLQGELAEADLEEWANAVEGRDDIGFESEYKGLLGEFVFETANPELAAPISENYARLWVTRLREDRPSGVPGA